MIRSWLLSELLDPLQAELIGDDVSFFNVSTDTRRLRRGELFLALKGPNFDGHAFIQQAAEKGAVAVVVSDTQADCPLPQIKVADTTRALGQLGALNRQAFSGRLVAVTGSSGKTTVKEMLTALLSEAGAVIATKGNLNNHIGVPLTLLSIAAQHEFAVVEMGASADGEIDYSAGFARPDVSLVNNASAAHLDGFGSVETIAREKGAIYSQLADTGVAVINADESYSALWREMAAANTQVAFSIEGEADIWASDIELEATGSRFTLHAGREQIAIRVPQPGRHNVANAVAAAACALNMGLTLAQLPAGFEALKDVPGRLQRRVRHDGLVLIDDTYNANPRSVRAAIDVLAAQPGRRLLVLGDMAELGDEAAKLHADVARYAADKQIEQLHYCGAYPMDVMSGFRGAAVYPDRDELLKTLKRMRGEGITMLIKGSRSAAMDEVVYAMLGEN